MVNTFTTVFLQSLTASIGNLNAEEKDDKLKLNDIFSHVFFINYILHAFCAVCLFCLLDAFIALWIGEAYCMGLGVSLVVSINYYFLGVQRTAEHFKSACGLFWQDRFRVLIESVINLIISILFVLILPMEWKVLGVLLGTLIANLCVSFWVEPLIVHKYALKKKVALFYLKNLLYFLLTSLLGASVFLLNNLLFGQYGNLVEFLLRAITTATCTAMALCIIFANNKYFRKTLRLVYQLLMKYKRAKNSQ